MLLTLLSLWTPLNRRREDHAVHAPFPVVGPELFRLDEVDEETDEKEEELHW